MTFQTRLAFVEDCSHALQCQKNRRQLQSEVRHFSAFQMKMSLDVSLEGLMTTAESGAPAVSVDQAIPTPISVPTANFDTSSSFEPVVFEPVLNIPSLITFIFVSIIFSALILRTNQVEDAVQRRKLTLSNVRALKAKEIGEGSVSPEEVQQTLQEYENAVRQEEKLRNILPGVRIVPPSSSDRKEEQAQAIAKQYLGQDFNIGVPERYNEKQDDEGSLSKVAIGILAMVALSQIGLLAFFSFGTNPMSGDGSL